MHKPTIKPARTTATVAVELQGTSDLRSAVVHQRAELERDLDAAVSACIRSASTQAYVNLHARAGALRDLAGTLAEREAALSTELRACEAWDADAPTRAKEAARAAEARRMNERADNATAIVEAAIRDADPRDMHWSTRGHGACTPALVAELPGCRLGKHGEPFAVVQNRGLLDEALRIHKDALARGGARGVLEAITRKNARPTPWVSPSEPQGRVSII